MHDDPLEMASDVLGAARTRIEGAHVRLRRPLDAFEGDRGPIRLAISRLDRLASEVSRIGRKVVGPSVAPGQAR